jgi:hypothetical protein
MARTFSAEVAATVRPWGLLTVIALTYAAYTLQADLPARIKHAAPRVTLPAVQLRTPLLTLPRTVITCVQDGTVTYSDRPCAPNTLFDVLVLPPD